ncbi:hypothetical protein IFM89_008959, partial [Coptis chinensis]
AEPQLDRFSIHEEFELESYLIDLYNEILQEGRELEAKEPLISANLHVVCGMLKELLFSLMSIPTSMWSLRNCSLQGPVPDLSRIPNLGYLDLKFGTHFNGSIPSNKLFDEITTMYVLLFNSVCYA